MDQLNDLDRRRLRRAARQQIKASGGLEAAAGYCRASVSLLGFYHNLNRDDYYMPVDVLASLMLDSGEAPLLRALAEVAGMTLTPRDHSLLGVNQSMAAFSAAAAEGFANYAAAIANGGIEAGEAETIARDLDQVIATARAAQAALGARHGE
jgi:F0F1-type ATP synthase membrane subunit c/vacuolar-type H+-ATPase subunit K